MTERTKRVAPGVSAVVRASVRTTPRVGSKVWFSPRRFGGWGWQPASVEGWLITIATLVGVCVSLIAAESAPWLTVVGVCLSVGIVLIACYFKGTSPGGKSEAEEFRASS